MNHQVVETCFLIQLGAHNEEQAVIKNGTKKKQRGALKN